jgi:glycerophosphoryl diester phosphodiesterase
MSQVFDPSRIYAHRGCWSPKSEQNSLKSFQIAARQSYSIETDFRERNSQVFISHDPITEFASPLSAISYFNIGAKTAMNLKSDGLAEVFEGLRWEIESSQSWIFDGSIPEMYKFKQLGFKHALRLSEFERELSWEPDVVWLDCFNSDWFVNSRELVSRYEMKEIVFVSPELHGRNQDEVWNFLAELIQGGNSNISICTDYPDEFITFVNT